MNACPLSGADLGRLCRAVPSAGLETGLPLAVKPLTGDGKTSAGASSNLGRSNEILAGVSEWATTARPSLMARTRHDGRDINRTEQHVALLGGRHICQRGARVPGQRELDAVW